MRLAMFTKMADGTLDYGFRLPMRFGFGITLFQMMEGGRSR